MPENTIPFDQALTAVRPFATQAEAEAGVNSTKAMNPLRVKQAIAAQVQTIQGEDGKSAYEIWIEEGNSGTEQDFLDSLKGADGEQGEDGAPGATGVAGEKGDDGKSAYQVWLDLGNTGTEDDFFIWLGTFATEITMSDFVESIENSLLSPFKWYLITDYRTYAPILNSDPVEYVTGEIEQLYVLAINANQFKPDCISKTYPDEVVYLTIPSSVYGQVETGYNVTVNSTPVYLEGTYSNELAYGDLLLQQPTAYDRFVLQGFNQDILDAILNEDPTTIFQFYLYDENYNYDIYGYGYNDDWTYDALTNEIIILDGSNQYLTNGFNAINFYSNENAVLYFSISYNDNEVVVTQSGDFAFTFEFDRIKVNNNTEIFDKLVVDQSFYFEYYSYGTYVNVSLNADNYNYDWTYDTESHELIILEGSTYLSMGLDFTNFAEGDYMYMSFNYIITEYSYTITRRVNLRLVLDVQADYRAQLYRRYKSGGTNFINNTTLGVYGTTYIVGGTLIYYCVQSTSVYKSTADNRYFFNILNEFITGYEATYYLPKVINGVPIDLSTYIDYPLFPVGWLESLNSPIHTTIVHSPSVSFGDFVFLSTDVILNNVFINSDCFTYWGTSISDTKFSGNNVVLGCTLDNNDIRMNYCIFGNTTSVRDSNLLIQQVFLGTNIINVSANYLSNSKVYSILDSKFTQITNSDIYYINRCSFYKDVNLLYLRNTLDASVFYDIISNLKVYNIINSHFYGEVADINGYGNLEYVICHGDFYDNDFSNDFTIQYCTFKGDCYENDFVNCTSFIGNVIGFDFAGNTINGTTVIFDDNLVEGNCIGNDIIKGTIQRNKIISNLSGNIFDVTGTIYDNFVAAAWEDSTVYSEIRYNTFYNINSGTFSHTIYYCVFQGLLSNFITSKNLDRLLIINDTSYKLGLGTANPTEKLDVVGNIKASGTVSGSNLSGTNTGDQDLSGRIPYSGATNDVDLGSHNMTTTGEVEAGIVTVTDETTGQSVINEGLVVNESGGSSADCDFRVETDTTTNAFFIDASEDTAEFNVNLYLKNIKSGATQVAAGASAGEIWATDSHATLPDNVLMIGV